MLTHAPTIHPVFQLRLLRAALLSLGLLTVLQACRPADDSAVAPGSNPTASYPSDVAMQWSQLHLSLVRNGTGFSPPVAARTFAYAGLAFYEAVVAGMPEHQSMAKQLQGLSRLPLPGGGQPYNWALSANAAQATVLRGLFANATAAQKGRIDSLETALAAQLKSTDDAQNERSATYGRAIGRAIFEWSASDGGHEGYSRNFPGGFLPSTEPGTWRPTENGRTTPMQPYWGENRTLLASTQAIPMPVPLTLSTQVKSPYFTQYLEVYMKNRALTQEEKEIAVWWADDPAETFTPPGHSYNLARIAIRTTNADLAKAAETFARVGVAVNDAFVRCWKCKFTFNNERPYTFVRRAIDPAWVPFWPAPPFPGFPSGHSTQSAATATVLTDLYGPAFSFTDDSHVSRVRDNKRNVDFNARPFRSFWEAAEEAGWSRVLGGIHTRQDNDTGLSEGRTIGQHVNGLKWRK